MKTPLFDKIALTLTVIAFIVGIGMIVIMVINYLNKI